MSGKCAVAIGILSAGCALGVSVALACNVGHGTSVSNKRFAELKKMSSEPARAPAALAPFGGSDRNRWSTESVIANIIVQQIEAGFARGDVRDVAVSIPARFRDGGFHPYGDGQSNAYADFGPSWRFPYPPVVARREFLRNGQSRDVIVLHPTIAENGYEVRDMHGLVAIRPKGWDDWFPLSFQTQVLRIPDLVRGLPPSFNLSGNRTLPDPERILAESGPGKRTAFSTLMNHRFGPGYNTKPFEDANVHGRFPGPGGVTTAVGKVWTWVVDSGANSPLKHLYTCFERRQPDLEIQQGGVPSGAGWHHVGDAGETIVNSVERAPIPAALGNVVQAKPPTGKWSYDINGTITGLSVRAGEAFVTSRGQFHWYAVPVGQEVCTEIWVHRCEPTPANHWGFSCG